MFSPEHILLLFWEKLKTVNRMALCAVSHSTTPTGWNGRGQGSILVIEPDENTLIFQERGSWENGIEFSNTFRWTLDREEEKISLEHLRLEQPLFLFHLTPTGENQLTSIAPHLCKEDRYFAQALLDSDRIRLTWRVVGPKKDEHLEYDYF